MRLHTFRRGRFSILTLVLSLLVGLAAMPLDSQAQQYVSPIRISINGDLLALEEGSAKWHDGRLFLPMRTISEKLGATLEWQEVPMQMDVFYGDQQITWSAQRPSEATVNGQRLVLDIPPFLEAGRLMAPVRWTSETLGWTVEWLPQQHTVYISDDNSRLPVIGDFANLKQLLEQLESEDYLYRIPAAAAVQESAQAAASSEASGASAEAAGDYSATNVQVDGVDEADVVKTDGRFLYHLNEQRLAIAQALPADDMRWMSITSFKSSNFLPQEMYLNGDMLVLIGGRAEGYTSGEARPNRLMPQLRLNRNTHIQVYNVADRTRPELVRELEISGRYLTSRMIDSQVYLVAQQSIDLYRVMAAEDAEPLPGPAYQDSAAGDDFRYIDYGDIHYFPEHPTDSYLLIGSFDLQQPHKEMLVDAYLGNGDNLYASTNHLYIAAMTLDHSGISLDEASEAQATTSAATAQVPTLPIVPYVVDQTTVYKFALNGGKAMYINSGSVPGRLLNQFAMDEHQGNLRLVTTTEPFGRNGEPFSKNHLFVLNDNMKLQGSIMDIAPGERIYSARFMGERGYMVTFRTVDPLFAIDLSDPANPNILGELKIPGFSDYLHPLDENHLIGIGRHTVEVPFKNGDGSQSVTAYEKGMKLSLFDVTDPTQPVEKFSQLIGDRGTYSDVLRNHKALLFSADKQLLAFPLTVMKADEQEPYTHGDVPAYGHFSFQGAYVYRVNVQDGFEQRGAITHMSPEERQKLGQYHYGSASDIQRLLYIGDTLYSFSDDQIRATALDSLTLTGILPLKTP